MKGCDIFINIANFLTSIRLQLLLKVAQ